MYGDQNMTDPLSEIKVSPNDKIEVEIVFADNQLVILNNGMEVHATKSDRAGGRLNARVDLKGSLMAGLNYVSFVGIAWGARFQFNYNFLVNDQKIESHSDNTGQCPSGKGRAYFKSCKVFLEG